MKELFFLIEESPEGGYMARGIGESIFTEADTMTELKELIKDAVHCHFEPENMPNVIRLHVVRDEVMMVS